MVAPGRCTWISIEHWCSVMLHGTFTAADARTLRETLSRLVSPSGIVRVDLHDVHHMARAAIVALLDAGRRARRLDCEYTVIADVGLLRRMNAALDLRDRDLLGLHVTDGA